MVEPVSIAFHAINLTPVSLNDSVVVVGAGMVGVFVIQALRAAGCGKIIAVDLEQSKLDLALKLGADYALQAGQVDVPEEVKKLTDNRGAALAVEVVGNTPAVNTAVASLRKGGSLTIVGKSCPDG